MGGKFFERCLRNFPKNVCEFLFLLLTQRELFFADVAGIRRLGLVTWPKSVPICPFYIYLDFSIFRFLKLNGLFCFWDFDGLLN